MTLTLTNHHSRRPSQGRVGLQLCNKHLGSVRDGQRSFLDLNSLRRASRLATGQHDSHRQDGNDREVLQLYKLLYRLLTSDKASATHEPNMHVELKHNGMQQLCAGG